MKIIYLFFILFLFSCEGKKDSVSVEGNLNPLSVWAVLESNEEEDMSHYEIYFWQGKDPENFVIPNLILLDTLNHNPSLEEHKFPLSITKDYCGIGATAVNKKLYKSQMAVSRIYSYQELADLDSSKRVILPQQ